MLEVKDTWDRLPVFMVVPTYGLCPWCTKTFSLRLAALPDAHPVLVTIRDAKDHIRVLLCSYCTTVAG